MDPNLLKNIDYFAATNAQTDNAADQNVGESPATGATGSSAQAQGSAESSVWNPPMSLVEPGVSDEFSAAQSFAQQQPQTATTGIEANLTFGSLAVASPYMRGGAAAGKATTALPARGSQSATAPRRRAGHERKRTKVNSEAPALESADYWLQNLDDDDDNDRGGSFEIDFSKRQNANSNFLRASRSLNTMASTTPGLGTGIYTSSNTSHFKDDVDDSALDNALSDDEDDASLNLFEQLAKIETMPPSEVPPREGLYSTPLSWEKPQPGLRADPLLGASSSGEEIMSEAEQRRLFAIAMNAGAHSQQLAFQPGFGGLGFGYPGLGGGFPSLGAQSLLGSTSLHAAGLNAPSATAEKAKPQPQPQPKPQNPQGKAQAVASNQTAPGAKTAAAAELASGEKGPQNARLQRAASTGTTAVKTNHKGKPGDRTAHNDIERKYRTNLKDGISELRNAIPALREISGEGDDDAEEGGSAQRAPKVSKGTTLQKAVEYIHFLERRNKAILREHQELSRRLQTFDQLLNATARQPFPMPSYSRNLFDPRGFC